MNAQAILDKILQDAREAASFVLQEAQKNAEAMRQKTDAHIEAQREDTVRRAHEDAIAQESRMLRMAELEQRKAMLAQKRAVMDEAFARALHDMRRMPVEKARAYHHKLLLEAAQGGEDLIVGDPTPVWYNEAFLHEVNVVLAKDGHRSVTLAPVQRPVDGGFLLLREGLELNCTYEALLKTQRMALEGDVAAVLFP